MNRREFVVSIFGTAIVGATEKAEELPPGSGQQIKATKAKDAPEYMQAVQFGWDAWIDIDADELRRIMGLPKVIR